MRMILLAAALVAASPAQASNKDIIADCRSIADLGAMLIELRVDATGFDIAEALALMPPDNQLWKDIVLSARRQKIRYIQAEKQGQMDRFHDLWFDICLQRNL